MKKVYLTGITGTVAPYIKKTLVSNHFQVYDRHIKINHDVDILVLNNLIQNIKPDIIIHAALGLIEVTEMFASYANIQNIPFVYISTVSVFEDNGGGPYDKKDQVDVCNPYGLYKYNSEQKAIKINPNTYIIRLGWQISPIGDSKSNNMFKFIKDNTNDEGMITVSDQFYPSASFLDDTAEAIVNILKNKPGLYLVNSNPGYSLYEILHQLKEKFKLHIKINKDNTFKRNDLMIDQEVIIKTF